MEHVYIDDSCFSYGPIPKIYTDNELRRYSPTIITYFQECKCPYVPLPYASMLRLLILTKLNPQSKFNIRKLQRIQAQYPDMATPELFKQNYPEYFI